MSVCAFETGGGSDIKGCGTQDDECCSLRLADPMTPEALQGDHLAVFITSCVKGTSLLPNPVTNPAANHCHGLTKSVEIMTFVCNQVAKSREMLMFVCLQEDSN